MRMTLILIAALLTLSACGMPRQNSIVGASVEDPYVTTEGGVAVYKGDVNKPGTYLPGTPAPAPQAVEGQDFASVGTTVYFAEAQATLSDEARTTLARQAAWLTQNADQAAIIEGHADEPGTREFNLALGARRATAVQEYLVSKGVQAQRIRTVSYGNERPAAICSSEAACLARNRRAVTVVATGQAGV